MGENGVCLGGWGFCVLTAGGVVCFKMFNNASPLFGVL